MSDVAAVGHNTVAPLFSPTNQVTLFADCSPLQCWDTAVTRLNNRGVKPDIRYDGQGISDLFGGLRRGGTYLHNINLQLTLDLKTLYGWSGATAFLYGLNIARARPVRQLVGDAQGVSNLEAPPAWKVEEIWLQQNLFAEKFSVLAGRYDVNDEFYRLQSASLFLNNSFGTGPEFTFTGQEGPSTYPFTSVGARFGIKPSESLVFRAGVFDGVPVDRPDGRTAVFAKGDGALLLAEADYLNRPEGVERPRTQAFRIGRNCCGTYTDKYVFGAWQYTAKFNDLDPTEPSLRHRSGGFYALADQTVYQDSKDTKRRMMVFGEFGKGSPRVARFGYYTGAGVTFAALIPQRTQDECGIAVATAYNGDPYIQAQRSEGVRDGRAEVTFEVTYLAQYGAHVAVQPDVQFVIHPNTNPNITNAVAFILQLELMP